MRRLLCLGVALTALAGCGGGDGGGGAKTEPAAAPKPNEPLAAAAGRLSRLIPGGDCRQLARLMLHSVRRGTNVPPSRPPAPAECRFIDTEIRRDMPGFKVARVRQFGPAGLVEGTGTKAKGGFVVGTLWALDTDGSWKLLYNAILRPQTGFPPKPGLAANARAFLAAVQARDCGAIWRGLNVGSRFVRSTGGVRAPFCKSFLASYEVKGNGIADLASNPGVKPRRLGAARDIGFFGLPLKSGRYLVLVLTGRIGGIANSEQVQHVDPSVLEMVTTRRPAR